MPTIALLIMLISLFTPSFQQNSLSIPLTYSFNPNNEHKYPIQLSFNQTFTNIPFRGDGVYLYGLNVSMETVYSPSKQSIVIGLKHPSSFLYAIQSMFLVQSHEIEFSKGDFLEMLIKGNNFVESSDNFVNGGQYSILVEYNFGQPITVNKQECYLTDGQDVIFDEFFILEVLNSMDSRNEISFLQNPSTKTITISGQIENFPMISLLYGQSKFEISIKQNVLNYSPRGDQSIGVNYIGYMSLDKFGKFSIGQQSIIFKRTAQLFQLYLFFAYFFAFVLIFLITFRLYITDSMKFVKNVVAWVVFQKPQARIRVLRTELE